MSIEAIIAELVDAEQTLAVSKLTQLSSLGEAEIRLLSDSWPELALQKRQRLVVELIDLAEDGVEMNFDAVFFIGLADNDPEVRRDSIRGLWEHDSRKLTDTLLALLADDADAGVRADAALALGRLVLQSELDGTKSPLADAVEARLRDVYREEGEEPEVRGRALESLGARNEPWVRELIEEAYDGRDRRLRISALHAMGRSCDAAWLPVLYLELASDDDEVRFEAAGALGAIAEEESAERLSSLVDDNDIEVQEAAIGALGEIGGVVAKDALSELARGDDQRVREAAEDALEALAFLDDPLAFEAPA